MNIKRKMNVDFTLDIEVANRHGHTCLMIACYKGHIRIAKYLLSLNANVNRKSVKGNTALHDCAESGSLAILKLLIEHGATMDVDSYGNIFYFVSMALSTLAWSVTQIVQFYGNISNVLSHACYVNLCLYNYLQ